MNRISRQILQETGQEPDRRRSRRAWRCRGEDPQDLKIPRSRSRWNADRDDDDSHLGDFIEDQSTLAPSDAATFASLRDVTKKCSTR